MQVLKGLCRKEKEIDIWEVRKLCPIGEIHMPAWHRKAELAVQGDCAAQRRLSEAEADMDRKNWEQQNSNNALFETSREIESQRMELGVSPFFKISFSEPCTAIFVNLPTCKAGRLPLGCRVIESAYMWVTNVVQVAWAGWVFGCGRLCGATADPAVL